jgi:hypothetical protein
VTFGQNPCVYKGNVHCQNPYVLNRKSTENTHCQQHTKNMVKHRQPPLLSIIKNMVNNRQQPLSIIVENHGKQSYKNIAKHH